MFILLLSAAHGLRTSPSSSSKYSNVTVIGNRYYGNPNWQTRILQFVPGLIESKVVCEEPCEILPHEVQITAECKGCPCTVVKPYENMPGYLRQPIDHVAERCRMDARPQNVLVVGLGGGSMVNALRAVCEVRMVQIIEVSENVIHANKLFFGLNASVVTSEEELSDDPGTQVFQGDGEHGVQVMAHKFPEETFDTAFIDCMSGGRVPPGCKSDAIYSSIRKLLKPNADIYQWTMGSSKEDVQAGFDKHFGTSKFLYGWISAAKR